MAAKSAGTLQGGLRVLGAFGLIGLATSSTAVAFALRSPEPYGLGQLGVWIDQAALGLFGLAFMVVGVLTLLLPRRSFPAVAGIVLTAVGTYLVFVGGSRFWLSTLPASVAIVLYASVPKRSVQRPSEIGQTQSDRVSGKPK
jgi:hypothetical protein